MTDTLFQAKRAYAGLKSISSRLLFADLLPSPYPGWNGRGDVEEWMRGKIAHFRKHKPENAYQLFDISCGDYLPKSVHVGSSFGKEELEIYRELKRENSDLVTLARKSTGHYLSRSTIYDPDDWPGENMYPYFF